jgi:hypothetical protein
VDAIGVEHISEGIHFRGSWVFGLRSLFAARFEWPKDRRLKTKDQSPKTTPIKKPRAKQRDFKIRLKFFGPSLQAPELFSWLFYVAASRLNSPRFSSLLIRRAGGGCQVWANNSLG